MVWSSVAIIIKFVKVSVTLSHGRKSKKKKDFN